MRAAVLYGAGDLRLEERRVPDLHAADALIAVESVGLCGSDLHYYQDGRNGPNVVRSPAVLGHEIGGTVAAVGPGVSADLVGTRVVVEPAAPCRICPPCTSGRYNLCPNGVCLGSPPIAGGLAQHVVVPAAQLHRAPDGLDRNAVPVLEPLAVAVHALRRAAFAPGQSVLVTGAGPVGLLVAQVATAWGACEVTVTDVDEARLEAARGLGIDTAVHPEQLGDAQVDRSLECSGAPAALAGALAATRPGGRVVLVGTMPTGDLAAPLGLLQRYEVDLVGTFRYAGTFPTAVGLVARGEVDIARLVTATYPLANAVDAFAYAASGAGLKTTIDCTSGGGRDH
jgi:L-iditol 2-dehydrogenase